MTKLTQILASFACVVLAWGLGCNTDDSEVCLLQSQKISPKKKLKLLREFRKIMKRAEDMADKLVTAVENGSIQETPPLDVVPAIPLIDYTDVQRTVSAWQKPLQKTYDNGVRLPALGWNSWNQFGMNSNQSAVLAVAKAMKSTGLLDRGYEYIIQDDGWALPDRNAEGQMQADPAKFPNGMKWLADQLHSLGFKFGIYTSVGENTCGGLQPGIMGHHQIDAETFASWGVDYVKVDRCGWPTELSFAPGVEPYDLPQLARIIEGKDWPENGSYPSNFYIKSGRGKAYKEFSAALNSTGRLIYYEICDWGEDDTLQFAPQISNSFRMSWDNFPQWHRLAEIYEYFAAVTDISASTSPGAYSFADILEGGVDGHFYNQPLLPGSSMSQTESATEQAMWSMWNSALILGFDVSNPQKSWAVTLAENPAMLKINQDPLGIAARLAVRQQQTVCGKCEEGEPSLVETARSPANEYCMLTDVWVKPLAKGEVAVALVNMAGSYSENSKLYRTESISVDWGTLGLDASTSAAVYSATEQKNLGTFTGSFSTDVAPHGAVVLKLTPQL